MTECERIVKAGILPDSFFNEEVVCDFLVSKERKELFAVLLDLLIKIDSVCRRNDIKYFLIGGTLLGAVRHQGMIPWDDDIDIVMFRDDYEKFIALTGEFNNPYFLQTPDTDSGFFWSNATVRNSNTTAVTPYFAYQHMNHGAFVDIFVLDKVLNTDEARNTFSYINQLSIDNSTFMRMSNQNLDEKNKKRVEEYRQRIRDPYEVYNEIHQMAQKYNSTDSKYVTMFTGSIYGFDRTLFHIEDFASSILMKFEGYSFPVPIGWENVLKTAYGNYHLLPPIEKRGIHHNIIYNMRVPYVEYIANAFL